MNPIQIEVPQPPHSAGFSELDVEAGCVVDVSGIVDTLNYPGLSNKLESIWARIGTGPVKEGVVINGDSWRVDNVPNAFWSTAGVDQTVFVDGYFDDATYPHVPNMRTFTSRHGDAGCQYYHTATEFASPPIQEVMPRYFKVSAEFGGQQAFGSMAGGLLTQGALFLSYDSASATPELPVWRDVGLPKSVGAWLLRVRRHACGYEARLAMQAATETCILPATTFLTRNWSFRKRNLFHGSLNLGHGKFDVTLSVEPS